VELAIDRDGRPLLLPRQALPRSTELGEGKEGSSHMTRRAQVQALKLLGHSNAQIGQALGICEGTVRYHLRRQGCEDRRKGRPRKLDALASAIDHWVLAHYPLAESGEPTRPIHVRPLYDWLRQEHGYEGCHRSVVRYLRARYPRLRLRSCCQVGSPGGNQSQVERPGASWVLRLLLGKEPLSAVRNMLGDFPDLRPLYRAVREGGCKRRKKALVVLASLKHMPPREIARALLMSQRTVMKYWEVYRTKGLKRLFAPPLYRGAKSRDESLRAAVLSLLHSPPSTHNINRTSWKMEDLRKVLRGQGVDLSAGTIRKIIRSTGFRWRKARTVLTSNDPQYKEKVARVTSVLASLGPKERFFSIDEFGPFAIKMTGGLVLCDPDRVPVIPQYQKSKGSLIVTAALELSTNQVTHFFSAKKDTEEMIKLLDVLLTQYADCERIYLSWDAASWHDSRLFHDRVAEVNSAEYRATHHTPLVELVPLPSKAQFLNVIESVFSGMARAIIHNSDYQSVEEAKAAVDRYFRERNEYFTQHPKRAGRKIWGKERVPSQFSEANNCKDPLWSH
jgi:transposase